MTPLRGQCLLGVEKQMALETVVHVLLVKLTAQLWHYRKNGCIMHIPGVTGA